MYRSMCPIIGASLSEPHTSEPFGTPERYVHKNLQGYKDSLYVRKRLSLITD